MELTPRLEHWKLKQPFSTSQFTISQNTALTVELRDGGLIGRGECEPHESDAKIAADVLRSIERHRDRIEAGLSRQELQQLMPAGPARNALDCALWDLEAKRTGRRAWELAGIALDAPLATAFVIVLASPAEMGVDARKNRDRPLLKVKLGRERSLESIESVRRAAPDARLIVDVNGAWTIAELNRLAGPLATLGVELIEQPLAAEEDADLRAYQGTIPLCADESCTDTRSLGTLSPAYTYINIKLDKTGGLTEALRLAEAARSRSLGIMVGCMNGTSLAIAPAMVIGAQADLCDLDAPLLLEQDRVPGLGYDNSLLHVPAPEVWG